MQLFYILYGVLILLTLIIMMAMMVKWGIQSDPVIKSKWSKIWHSWSLLPRLEVMGLWLVLMWGQWLTLLLLLPIYMSICWVVWDGVIAWFLNQNFWYIGNTAVTDKIFTQKVSMDLKIILIVISAFATTVLIIL